MRLNTAASGQLHHHQVGGDGEAAHHKQLCESQPDHHLNIIGDGLEGMIDDGELTHHQPSADDEPETSKNPPKSKPTHQKPEATMGDQPKPIQSGGRSLKIKEKQKQTGQGNE